MPRVGLRRKPRIVGNTGEVHFNKLKESEWQRAHSTCLNPNTFFIFIFSLELVVGRKGPKCFVVPWNLVVKQKENTKSTSQ